jgi:hypothetical protein
VTEDEVKRIFALARKQTIDTLDTAVAYGNSEFVLGEVGVSDFNIVTKLPAYHPTELGPFNWATQTCLGSLGRLNVSVLYGLLLHRPSQLFEPEGQEIYRAMIRLKDAGRVKKIGISIYSPSELEALFQRFEFDIVQTPLSLIDRRVDTSGWLDRLKNRGVEVHARSIFLQGLLLMPRELIPASFARWNTLWDRWHGWLKHSANPALDACLQYALSIKAIDRIVIGVESARQLGEAIDAYWRSSMDGIPDISCDDEALVNPSRWVAP